jgi:hypothetical protein
LAAVLLLIAVFGVVLYCWLLSLEVRLAAHEEIPLPQLLNKLIVHRLNFQHFEQSNMTRSSRWSECIIGTMGLAAVLLLIAVFGVVLYCWLLSLEVRLAAHELPALRTE